MKKNRIKHIIREYSVINKTVIGTSGKVIVLIMAVVFCLVPVFANKSEDIIQFIILGVVAFTAIFTLVMGNISYITFKSIGYMPFKSIRLIKYLYAMPHLLAAFLFVPSIIIFMIMGNWRMVLIYLAFILLLVNMLMLLVDGKNPQKQEFKIWTFVLICTCSGVAGGTITASLGGAFEMKNTGLLYIILCAIIAVLAILACILRKFRFRKYLINMME